MRIYMYVTPWVGNLMEQMSCVFNNLSGGVVLGDEPQCVIAS
jgi:hypothetical protein